MRKLLTAIIATSFMATPALARDHYREYDRHDRHEHHGGGWVAPLIGGIVLGAVLADRRNEERQEERREQRVVRYGDRWYYYEPYQPTCWEEERVDYYGYIRTYRVCR